jgi:hypothetical protein
MEHKHIEKHKHCDEIGSSGRSDDDGWAQDQVQGNGIATAILPRSQRLKG